MEKDFDVNLNKSVKITDNEVTILKKVIESHNTDSKFTSYLRSIVDKNNSCYSNIEHKK